MKKIFRRRMIGDLVVSYDEILDKESPVIMGVISCQKRVLEKLYNGIPEYLELVIELPKDSF